jgi:hypothetical protein
MATYQILFWKSIPTVVQATDSAGSVKVQLSDRFQGLVDAVAMREGLAGTDAYLEQWEHGDETERAGTARDVAAAVAAELERRFEDFRVQGLGRAGQ